MAQCVTRLEELKEIRSFEDFLLDLDACGFTLAGVNPAGVFTLSSRFGSNITWHTGLPDTDPWEWRIRVLEEHDDIAYAKLFFKKGGYIRREYYPYFAAIRRPYGDVCAAYAEGVLSGYARRLCEEVAHAGAIPMHELKKSLGVTREDTGRFERALVELQMLLYITICGSRQKVSSGGESYGWYSTMFCTSDAFFGEDMTYEARYIAPLEAYRALESRIYGINPDAEPRKVRKFIGGLSPFPS